MAKSASPIRLQAELMQAATATAKRFHRSTAEQIEYWADVGRQTAGVIAPDVLLSLVSGLARIKVEPVKGRAIAPEEVFDDLEKARKEGSLSTQVTGRNVKYQVCEAHPGYLEQIDATGTVTVGQYEQGFFKPLRESKD